MEFSCILIIALASHSAYSFKIGKTDDKLYNGGHNGTVLDLPAHINISGSLPEVYIVGGVPATRNEFPWLVHLNADGSFCGGTLIEMNMVLTAAHCLKNEKGETVSARKVTVVAGDHSRSVNDGTEQQVTASGVYLHENYNYPRAFANDIALIRLSRNLTRTIQVRPIPLPTRGPAYSSRGTVAGWGSTREGGSISDILRKVEVQIITGTTCSNQMTNPSGQFCAGETNKDSCQGDSGGPFICLNSPNEICGIVSYGEGCARAGNPGVYTNVKEYNTWINKNLNFVYSTATTDHVASKILVISFYFSILVFSR